MSADKFILLIAVLSSVIFSPSHSQSGDATAMDRKKAAGDKEAVVVRMRGSAITAEDFISYLDTRPIVGGKETSEEAVKVRLEEMITSEVLYLEALRLKIDRDPQIRQVIRQLLSQRVIKEKVNQPIWERKITKDELQKYYNDHIGEFSRPEQVRLADIFIAVPENAPPDVRHEKLGRAREALGEVQTRQGRFVFGEVTAKYSDRPKNYEKGDTGFLDRKGSPVGLDKKIVEAAFSLTKNGEIYNKIIETERGFHIIMLVGRRSAFNRSLDDVAPQLEKRIRREEMARKRKDYIQSLRERTEVHIDEQVLENILDRLKKSKGSGASGRRRKSHFPPGLPSRK